MATAPEVDLAAAVHVYSETSSRAIFEGLRTHFNDPRLSDIVLVRPDGRHLHVHQVILASCSRKFASVLARGDATGKELPIQGVDSAALESVVGFFYCGECLLSSATVVPIYDVCLKLDVPGLAAGCEQYIQQSMNPQSCVVYLAAAARLLLEPTVKLCLSYAKSRFDEVTATAAFQTLSPNVVRLLLTHVRSSASDVSLARALARWAVRKPDHLSECEAIFKDLNITATALLQLLQMPDFAQALQHGTAGGAPAGGEEDAAAARGGHFDNSAAGGAAAAAAAAAPHREAAPLRFGEAPAGGRMAHHLQHQGRPQHSSSGSGAVQEAGPAADAEVGRQLSALLAECQAPGGAGGSGRLAAALAAAERAGDSSQAMQTALLQSRTDAEGRGGAWPSGREAPRVPGASLSGDDAGVGSRTGSGLPPLDEPAGSRRRPAPHQLVPIKAEDPDRQSSPVLKPAGRLGAETGAADDAAAAGAASTLGRPSAAAAGDGAVDVVAVPLAVLEQAGLSMSMLPSGDIAATGGPLGRQQLPLQLVSPGPGPQAPLLALLPAALVQHLQQDAGQNLSAGPEAGLEQPQLQPHLPRPFSAGVEAADPDGSSGIGEHDAELPDPQAQAAAAVAASQLPPTRLPPRFTSTGTAVNALLASAASLGAAMERSASLPRGRGQLGGGLGAAAGISAAQLQHQFSSSDPTHSQWPNPASATSAASGGAGNPPLNSNFGGAGFLAGPHSPHIEGQAAGAGASAKRRRGTSEDDDPDHVEEVGSRGGRGSRGSYAGRSGDGGTQGGGATPTGSKAPLMCHVDDCQVDLTALKEYHQRFRICDFHLKAEVVMREGIPQRFCQQCGRFHVLSEFDGAKRSCRARLQRHNARRRKRPESRDHGGGDGGSDEPRKPSRSASGYLPPAGGGGAATGLRAPPPPLPPQQLMARQPPQQLLPRELQDPPPLPLLHFPSMLGREALGGAPAAAAAQVLPPPLMAARTTPRDAAAAAAATPSSPLQRLQQQLELQQGLLLLQREQQQQREQREQQAQLLRHPILLQQQGVGPPPLQQQQQLLSQRSAPTAAGEARAPSGLLAALLGGGMKRDATLEPADPAAVLMLSGDEVLGPVPPRPPQPPSQEWRRQPQLQGEPGRVARAASDDSAAGGARVLEAAEALAALAGAAATEEPAAAGAGAGGSRPQQAIRGSGQLPHTDALEQMLHREPALRDILLGRAAAQPPLPETGQAAGVEQADSRQPSRLLSAAQDLAAAPEQWQAQRPVPAEAAIAQQQPERPATLGPLQPPQQQLLLLLLQEQQQQGKPLVAEGSRGEEQERGERQEARRGVEKSPSQAVPPDEQPRLEAPLPPPPPVLRDSQAAAGLAPPDAAPAAVPHSFAGAVAETGGCDGDGDRDTGGVAAQAAGRPAAEDASVP